MSLQVVAYPVPLTADSHGVVRVARTRVTLDTVVYAFQEGATAEEIAHQYPSLQLADIYAVISYYLRDQGVVDAYLEQRNQQATQVRKENEARTPPDGIRSRLLARRSSPA